MHFNLQDIYTFASKILRGTNSEFRINVLYVKIKKTLMMSMKFFRKICFVATLLLLAMPMVAATIDGGGKK